MRGSISRRGDAFQLKIELPRRADGRRKYKYATVRGSQRDADRALARLVHEVLEGTFFEPSTTPFGTFLDEWLHQTGSRLSGRSHERVRRIIDRHLKPRLGDVPLARLTPLMIQTFYTDALEGRDGKKLSPPTVLKFHHVLHRALRQAVRWRLIGSNPADAVDPPKVTRKEMLALDPAQAAALLAAADGGRLHAPILVTIGTGLRRGEVLGLRWADVDLQMGTITVRQTLEETAAGVAFKVPKTRKSARTLPVGATVVAALKRHKVQQDEVRLRRGESYQDNDLVFPQSDGAPWSPAAFSLAFMRLVRHTQGLPPVRFHDLRHSHASQLLAQGVHPKIVSERLGHANISITLDTYSHVLPGLQEAAVQQFDQALQAALKEKAG